MSKFDVNAVDEFGGSQYIENSKYCHCKEPDIIDDDNMNSYCLTCNKDLEKPEPDTDMEYEDFVVSQMEKGEE